MTKTKINYDNTIIYKIVCSDSNITDFYVGHTTNFTKRKTLHKSDCNNENSPNYNIKLYKTIRENGGWDDWNMIEIEKYNCNDGNEARARERHWYEQLKANLNVCYPNRGNKESRKTYYDNNREMENEKCKIYRQNNLEKEKEMNKKYKEEHKEQITRCCRTFFEAQNTSLNAFLEVITFFNKNKNLLDIKDLSYIIIGYAISTIKKLHNS